ncbi:MAG: hypothetical protein M3463_21390 [Verrucomicrobiota bacterium]|nr:hypothetical protein [Verrucomicrobiota bacterium]
MGDFNTLFPNFLDRCAELNRVLTPVAIVLFVVGIVSSTVTGHRSPGAYLRTIARTCVYVAVLASLLKWGTEIATSVDDTVKNTLQANPKQVHANYQEALTMQKGASDDKSWWELLDAQAIFEGVLSAILVAFGWLAGVIVFYAYLAQKFILYIAYGFAPLFIGFLAVRSLHSIGVSYLLGFVGVLCWPLGWGAASIMTKGLLDFMADQSLLSLGAAGAAGYALQNLLGIAALALWLIFSTIAAPIIIQRAITTGAQIGQALAGGAVTAGVAGAVSGAGAATAISSGGGVLRGAAGLVGGGAASAIGAAEASTTGSTYSPLGNLLGSMASQRPARRSPTKPKKDDPTGDEAVREMLQRQRN